MWAASTWYFRWNHWPNKESSWPSSFSWFFRSLLSSLFQWDTACRGWFPDPWSGYQKPPFLFPGKITMPCGLLLRARMKPAAWPNHSTPCSTQYSSMNRDSMTLLRKQAGPPEPKANSWPIWAMKSVRRWTELLAWPISWKIQSYQANSGKILISFNIPQNNFLPLSMKYWTSQKWNPEILNWKRTPLTCLGWWTVLPKYWHLLPTVRAWQSIQLLIKVHRAEWPAIQWDCDKYCWTCLVTPSNSPRPAPLKSELNILQQPLKRPDFAMK